nr:hypothetical protein CFP56_54936 [Quercus suber]
MLAQSPVQVVPFVSSLPDLPFLIFIVDPSGSASGIPDSVPPCVCLPRKYVPGLFVLRFRYDTVAWLNHPPPRRGGRCSSPALSPAVQEA